MILLKIIRKNLTKYVNVFFLFKFDRLYRSKFIIIFIGLRYFTTLGFVQYDILLLQDIYCRGGLFDKF